MIRQAVRSAFSFASAPLLTKNTVSSGSAENSTSLRAARLRTSIGTALLWKATSPAWRSSAASQPGWP